VGDVRRMRGLLQNPSLRPQKEDILASVEHFRRVLRVRHSSPPSASVQLRTVVVRATEPPETPPACPPCQA